MKNKILNNITIIGFLMFATAPIFADELTHRFKNPSFSGVGTSSHYLTVENQEKSRRDAIEDDIESALKSAERDAENTTLAKFFRNLESRIYAQLSKQLVESLFSTCDPIDITCSQTTFGSFMLEGNQITYQKTTCDASIWSCSQDEEVVVMTIVGEDGTETIIVIPIGAGIGGD
tara:strand:- start:199 stop:723 length:525 start_codon:yes stop_codon:yes gene_type:complete